MKRGNERFPSFCCCRQKEKRNEITSQITCSFLLLTYSNDFLILFLSSLIYRRRIIGRRRITVRKTASTSSTCTNARYATSRNMDLRNTNWYVDPLPPALGIYLSILFPTKNQSLFPPCTHKHEQKSIDFFFGSKFIYDVVVFSYGR